MTQVTPAEATIEADILRRAKANITFADTFTKAVSIPESANFGTIFAFHFFRALDILLRAPFRFIFFPFAAICGITKAALGWYRLYHDYKDKKELKIKDLIFTIWETINATVTTTAVILGAGSAIIGVSAATSAVIGMTISLMFTASLGVNTLLNLGFFAYHLYNAYFNRAMTLEEKAEHLANAKGHAIGTVILALLTTSVVIAMVAGMLVVGGALGIATCLVAVGLGIQDLYNHWMKKDESTTPTEKQGETQLLLDDNHDLSSSARVIARTRSQSLGTISMPDQSNRSRSTSSGELELSSARHSRPLSARSTASLDSLRSSNDSELPADDQTADSSLRSSTASGPSR